MKKIKTDLRNLDEIISRQYEDKTRGIVKDSMQNSWEARKHRKKGKDFKMFYRFFRDLDGHKNVLLLEDFSTLGMDNERWEAFHGHWFSTKGGDYQGGIGRWGQGKTLFLYFSSTRRIITESVDGKNTYRYSLRTNDEYIELGDKTGADDPDWIKKPDGSLKKIEDFFPSVKKLRHNGTRIWILDVKEDLAREIVSGYMANQISESWWELIRNYNIGIEVCTDISGKPVKIGLPQLPEEDTSQVHKLVPVGKIGKIAKLKFVLTKDPIPDSLRGIAIQRGGMTVCRYPMPARTPDEIRERVYGYCTMDSDLDYEMWKIELANHEGFEVRKKAWVELRKTIDNLSEEFIKPFIKSQEQPTLTMSFTEIIKTVNKLVEEHLHGLGAGGMGRTGEGGGGRTAPEKIRISPWGYVGSDRRFDNGDVMKAKGSIVNETEGTPKLTFKSWIESGNGGELWSYKIDKLEIKPGLKKSLDIPEIDFSTMSISKGKYSLKAEIRNTKKELVHRRTAVFYFEQDPPPMGGWLKKIHIAHLGGPREKIRNLPINRRGELLINQSHPELNIIWSSSQIAKREKANRIKDIVINICLHEATREAQLQWWGDESVSFDIDEIKKAKDIFDEMWGDYLRGR